MVKLLLKEPMEHFAFFPPETRSFGRFWSLSKAELCLPIHSTSSKFKRLKFYLPSPALLLNDLNFPRFLVHLCCL